MAIQWDPRLSVGVRLIDEQHQELFRRVNALLEAMEKLQGKEIIDRTLAFLGAYVKDHFGAEERLMAQHRYPQAALHKSQHEAFVKTFLELKAEYETKGASNALAVRLNSVVCGWLRQHIGATDRQLGQFLLSKGEQPTV
jgi:hemerythrin